jgi:hypothetical protein
MTIGRFAFVAVSLAALAGAGAGAAQTSGPAYQGDLVETQSEQSDRPPPRWHAPTPEAIAAADAALAAFNSPALTRFASEEEFRRYLGAVLAAQRARQGRYAASGHIQFAQAAPPGGAQSDTVEPICPETDPQCAQAGEEADAGSVVVTGTRISRPNLTSVSPVTVVGSASFSSSNSAAVTNGQITNNQMRNVEEGDIVKQINEYLLVLQDGRIFVVDTRAGGGTTADGRRLAVADRVNVYRNPREDMWYDEMLVFGDRVLITGYSYRHHATELSVFRLDTATGRLAREGVFYMTSNDYYDSSNYATRLIGDNLVIYTPFAVQNMTQATFKWPVVRRWRSDDERQVDIDRGSRPLFDAADIYRPVGPQEDPTVHTVSICPLGEAGGERNLECRSTAFIGPNTSQWYVTESDAYLWTTARAYQSYDRQSCDAPAAFEDGFAPALLYRVPVSGAVPGIAGVRGMPPDQFSLQASGGRFHALVKERQRTCASERESEVRLAYLDFPLEAFSRTLRDVGRDRYTSLPGVKSFNITNRFTETYLVYGSLGEYRRGLSQDGTPPAYVVPIDRPQDVRAIPLPHSMIRAERAGNDFVVTGYRDVNGLFVTLIDLDGTPRIASSVRLEQRYESEGRSHAFNSLIEADGSGVMGLPTIGGENRSSRAAWRSSASDLSFLVVDPRGRLTPVGELERRFDYGRDGAVPGYTCEVSCIDWYGNSRPIFTDGRVFALTGTELIEGRIRAGEIEEVQRLNIALPPRRMASR